MTKSAAIMGVINALLAALLAFGIALTDTQVVAISAAANAVLILIAAFLDPKIPFGRQEPPFEGFED